MSALHLLLAHTYNQTYICSKQVFSSANVLWADKFFHVPTPTTVSPLTKEASVVKVCKLLFS
jgi:hypothetical protein